MAIIKSVAGTSVIMVSTLAATLLVTPLFTGSAFADRSGRADIAIIGVTDDPDPAVVGQSVAYSVGINNFGPRPATGVTLTVTLPAGMRVESVPEGCTEPDAVITCSLGSIPARTGVALPMILTPPGIGLYELTFAVAAEQRDFVPANNAVTVTTTVVEGAADVSLSLPENTTAVAGQPFFFAISVGNAGPSTADGLLVTLELPAGITPVSAMACGPSGGGTTCTIQFGTLPAGAGSVLPAQLLATAPGGYVITGTVAALQSDPEPSDNADNAAVTAQ